MNTGEELTRAGPEQQPSVKAAETRTDPRTRDNFPRKLTAMAWIFFLAGTTMTVMIAILGNSIGDQNDRIETINVQIETAVNERDRINRRLDQLRDRADQLSDRISSIELTVSQQITEIRTILNERQAPRQ